MRIGSLVKAVVGLTAAVWAGTVPGPAAFGHSTHNSVVKETYTAARSDGSYRPPDPASLGGSFELIDHNGRTVTDRSYQGKWLLIFFGFTGCRESCPVGLERMTAALEDMGEEAEQIQPLFIDVDLEKPDPKALAQFVSNFHPRLVGLAGNRRQNFHIVRIFKVRREYGHFGWSAKETGPRLDHSTYFYLVDPEGRTRTYFYHSLPPAEMAATIRRHMAAR